MLDIVYHHSSSEHIALGFEEMEFEWNPDKAASNLSKHSVSFQEARTVFGDPFAATVADPDHSTTEERYIAVGLSDRFRLLLVAYTERNGRIRIISARELTSAERKAYERGDF